MFENLARDKHSSLLPELVNYGWKKFCNIGPKPQSGFFFVLFCWLLPSVTRRFDKKSPNILKSSPKSLQAKKGQNIYSKARFESPKHQHQLLKP
jgi:hypothetical protein